MTMTTIAWTIVTKETFANVNPRVPSTAQIMSETASTRVKSVMASLIVGMVWTRGTVDRALGSNAETKSV